MEIELGKGKEKEQRLEDGAILDKVKKSREREEEKDGEMAEQELDDKNMNLYGLLNCGLEGASSSNLTQGASPP